MFEIKQAMEDLITQAYNIGVVDGMDMAKKAIDKQAESLEVPE